MANNDKLQKIISDILTLKDLTNSMMDTENYSVSFFSQAFDLMQQIQGDFHKLEADQVELFALQMKKHQAQILSIHRQMRYIDTSPAEQPVSRFAPKVAPSTATTEPVPVKKQKTEGTEENKQKKTPFLSCVGISEDPGASEDVVRRPAVTHTNVVPPPTPVANSEDTGVSEDVIRRPAVAHTNVVLPPTPVANSEDTGVSEDVVRRPAVAYTNVAPPPILVANSKDPGASEDVVRRPAVAYTNVAPPPTSVANSEDPGASEDVVRRPAVAYTNVTPPPTSVANSEDPEASEDVVRKPTVAYTNVAPPPTSVANTESLSRNVSPQTITETLSPPVKQQTEVLSKRPVFDLPKTSVWKKIEMIRTSDATESETVKKTAKSTITIPELSPERIIRPPRQGMQTLSKMTKMPETKVTNVANGIPMEGSAPPSVNDAIEKRKLSDLRKAFSLNDRFLYRRELFGGSEEMMNNVIAALNNKPSYQESIRFLEEKLHWDFTHPIVKAFIKILELRFL
jgi:hypothetical protein